jgi:hypothetical protein
LAGASLPIGLGSPRIRPGVCNRLHYR